MSLDILSYGEASKAKRMLTSAEKKIGSNAKDYYDGSKTFNTVKERVDSLTDQVIAHYKLTDDLAIQNAINIMKAHARLDLLENMIRFEGDSFLFDDLADQSGIDTSRSAYNFASSIITGIGKEVITVPFAKLIAEQNLIYCVDAEAGVEVYVTHEAIKQDGDGNDIPVTWRELKQREGRYIFKAEDLVDAEMRMKFVIPSGKKVYSYGWVTV